MAGMKPLIAGNWKMFGRRADIGEILAIGAALSTLSGRLEAALCPPATLLTLAAQAATDTGLRIGSQDCALGGDGAHTGDLNAAMLADAGAHYVIVGHSERRKDHGESDALVRAKAEAVLAARLSPIICIGETQKEREEGRAVSVVERQIAESVPRDAPNSIVVAYEPVWAIGSGLTPTTSQIAEIHGAVRDALAARLSQGADGVRILYGGSVKPSNAAEIFGVAGVDGALVGGASLKAADFVAILQAHPLAKA